MKHPKGFTLIELMVGLAVALITVVIIAQVMVTYDSQKRSTIGGNDAQVTGALALYTLQQDLQMAGYGIASTPAILGCQISATYGTTALLSGSSTPLAPVIITRGTSSDSLRVYSSNHPGYAVAIKVTSAHAQNDAVFSVQASNGVSAGDLMLVAPASASGSTTDCSIFTVNAGTSAALTSTTIPHATDSGFNQTNVLPATGYAAGSLIIDLGRLLYREYTVSTRGLQMREVSTDNPSNSDTANPAQTLFPQVVVLKALYGKDTDGDGTVDGYSQTQPTTSAQWQQVLSIRLAIVVRNTHYAKSSGSDYATSSAPVWVIDSNTRITLTPPDVVNPGDWKNYRYKVFDTVIPLRNMLWNS